MWSWVGRAVDAVSGPAVAAGAIVLGLAWAVAVGGLWVRLDAYRLPGRRYPSAQENSRWWLELTDPANYRPEAVPLIRWLIVLYVVGPLGALALLAAWFAGA